MSAAKTSGSFLVQRPPLDELAPILETLFAEGADAPSPFPLLNEPCGQWKSCGMPSAG